MGRPQRKKAKRALQNVEVLPADPTPPPQQTAQEPKGEETAKNEQRCHRVSVGGSSKGHGGGGDTSPEDKLGLLLPRSRPSTEDDQELRGQDVH